MLLNDLLPERPVRTSLLACMLAWPMASHDDEKTLPYGLEEG